MATCQTWKPRRLPNVDQDGASEAATRVGGQPQEEGTLMPSKSKSQARLMAAAAHTPGGYGGVPQSVGRDFNKADKATGILRGKGRHATKGGSGASRRTGKTRSYIGP